MSMVGVEVVAAQTLVGGVAVVVVPNNDRPAAVVDVDFDVGGLVGERIIPLQDSETRKADGARSAFDRVWCGAQASRQRTMVAVSARINCLAASSNTATPTTRPVIFNNVIDSREGAKLKCACHNLAYNSYGGSGRVLGFEHFPSIRMTCEPVCSTSTLQAAEYTAHNLSPRR